MSEEEPQSAMPFWRLLFFRSTRIIIIVEIARKAKRACYVCRVLCEREKDKKHLSHIQTKHKLAVQKAPENVWKERGKKIAAPWCKNNARATAMPLLRGNNGDTFALRHSLDRIHNRKHRERYCKVPASFCLPLSSDSPAYEAALQFICIYTIENHAPHLHSEWICYSDFH